MGGEDAKLGPYLLDTGRSALRPKALVRARGWRGPSRHKGCTLCLYLSGQDPGLPGCRSHESGGPFRKMGSPIFVKGKELFMSSENGTVQRVENGWAWVLTERNAGCDHCGHKGKCIITEGADHMLVKAGNSAKARVGDNVELFLSTKTRMKSMLILYILPVMGLLVGALSAGSLSRVFGLSENLGTMIFTLVGLALAFALVRFLGQRMSSNQELTPAVSRIIRHSPHGKF